MQIIVSQIKYIGNLSQCIHLSHLIRGDTVIHAFIRKQQTVGAIAFNWNLTAQDTVVIIIIHEVILITVITENNIQTIAEFFSAATFLCFQLNGFVSS